VGYRDRRFLRASSGSQASELSTEVRVFCANRSMCRFDQRRAEPWAPASNATALALAGTLVVARTDARPGGEVSCGWETAHIRANLGDQHLGNTPSDPRNRIQSFDDRVERADTLRSPGTSARP